MKAQWRVGLLVPLLLLGTSALRGETESSWRRSARTAATQGSSGEAQQPEAKHVQPYRAELFRLARANDDYRRVLFTGARSQLVVMSLPPGQSIGVERHAHVEQTLVVVSGSGQVLLDGEKKPVRDGDVIVVTPGTEHNLLNTGAAPLKLFTIYVPPNHIDGRVHKTKQDAERDVEDERFGRQVK
jgi:mannose-6-phosphate isomerase-like protein (cupin superfamily)